MNEAANKATVETLVKAREVLWTKGWCQGTLENARGEVCVMGATMHANDGHALRAQNALAAEIPCVDEVDEALAHHLHPIARWNDEPGRTFDEVVDLFDRAIKSLESPE